MSDGLKLTLYNDFSYENGKVYKDKDNYTTFENLDKVFTIMDSHLDKNQKISLKNVKGANLSNYQGNDTIKLEGVKNSHFSVLTDVALIDGAKDKTKKPSAEDLGISSHSRGKLHNNLFWTKEMKVKDVPKK